MQVFPSGFQSLESLALLGLLAIGIFSASLVLVGIALALIAVLHKSSYKKPDDDFAF